MLVSSKVIPGIAYFILIIKAAVSQIVVKISSHPSLERLVYEKLTKKIFILTIYLLFIDTDRPDQQSEIKSYIEYVNDQIDCYDNRIWTPYEFQRHFGKNVIVFTKANGYGNSNFD